MSATRADRAAALPRPGTREEFLRRIPEIPGEALHGAAQEERPRHPALSWNKWPVGPACSENTRSLHFYLLLRGHGAGTGVPSEFVSRISDRPRQRPLFRP